MAARAMRPALCSPPAHSKAQKESHSYLPHRTHRTPTVGRLVPWQRQEVQA